MIFLFLFHKSNFFHSFSFFNSVPKQESFFVWFNQERRSMYFPNRSLSLSIHDCCMDGKKKLLLPFFIVSFYFFFFSFYQQSTIHNFFYVSVRIATSRQKRGSVWEDTLLWWHVARFFQNMLYDKIYKK